MGRPRAPGTAISPQILLRAYASGVFPMAEDADDPEVFWVQPQLRGIIPLDEFHVPRTLMKTVRRNVFEIAIDRDFSAVIDACGEAVEGRETTWINQSIREAYEQLHRMGHCHSVEARIGGELVGGLYGVTLGGAFFGESMFSRRTDASKVCLVHLVDRLIERGFVLLDTQFTTDHLRRFGAIDIPRPRYEEMLEQALRVECRFYP